MSYSLLWFIFDLWSSILNVSACIQLRALSPECCGDKKEDGRAEEDESAWKQNSFRINCLRFLLEKYHQNVSIWLPQGSSLSKHTNIDTRRCFDWFLFLLTTVICGRKSELTTLVQIFRTQPLHIYGPLLLVLIYSSFRVLELYQAAISKLMTSVWPQKVLYYLFCGLHLLK